MVKNDYIMRMISEMIRAVLTLLLGRDIVSKDEIVLPQISEDSDFQKLIAMVNEGRINEAENMLWDMTGDGRQEHFQIALLFYNYLNDLDDEVLEKADFSREEVADGLARIMKLYGYEDMARTFLL
ncbi:MAG TPA: hypothetical protein IAB46_10735 [Candidatus Scybalocola faecigallinarum]|uniref:Uncharacterized protein n=1 Tax=Candidatus Scybalocola faecigallinarum TaxID=2840941 RepID=A0A9D1F5S5_9FIRM|nr:hypothetical protein [Candidatus Scybalocola faecigallinarum]